MSAPGAPWSEPPQQVADGLGVDPVRGLDQGTATARWRREGPNRLQAIEPRSLLGILWAQRRSLLVGLLAVAAVIGFLSGDVEVKPAIAQCRAAGIRVVMITGDQRATASFVAQELRLLGSDDGRVPPVLPGRRCSGRQTSVVSGPYWPPACSRA